VKQHNVSAHVQFVGALDDAGLLAAYQQCDLFALPNRAVGNDVEGFGMVLLEAQACARPVLAGASGGTAETLQPGTTGVLVPCERPDEPASALAELLSDPARLERMGTAARARMETTFDWPARAAEAARVFAQVRAS
jgi:phosphatidyl-myo-inositol dimannoside synthase